MDRALLVLIAIFGVSFMFRIRMLMNIRSWSQADRARLAKSFNRQQKITSLVLLVVVVLMLVPMAFGNASLLLAGGATAIAAAVATVGGAWSNLKLRRLDFPRSYVRLHAVQATVIAVGVIFYCAILIESLAAA